MDVEQLFALAEEAYEVLETTLTEEDRERLQDIYKDVNSQIKWGHVIDNAFPVLLDLAEQLIETEGMHKDGGPWHTITESDQILFDSEEPKHMSFRHLLLLLLSKKLLGGLKTRVNQSIGDIRVLSMDEETELQEIVDEAEDLEMDARLDEDEDEIFEGEDAAVAKKQGEVVAEIDIAPEGDCRQSGRHVRTVVRVKRKNDEVFSETYCKDCRAVIKRTEGKTTKAAKAECLHPGAEWKEGLEGKEAVCTGCGEPIEDPSIFDWVGASLEPYGDDPTKDEVIVLCSDY